MNQTPLEGNSFSDGVSFETSIDAGSSYQDHGVMENGYSWTYAFATTDREWGNAENPDKVAKNQQITIAPSELATWGASKLAALSGGLLTTEVIAGTPVAGATQTELEDAWFFKQAIVLVGQNGDGTEPTINSVTGSVDGAGVLDDDYTVAKVAGGWAVIPYDGGVFDTEAQAMEVDYDYTPAASVNVHSGSTSTVLVPFIARFTHYTDAGKTTWDFRHTIFRVNPDAGGITLNKLGSKSDTDYDLYTVALTGDIDTSLEDGKQLDLQEYDDTVYG